MDSLITSASSPSLTHALAGIAILGVLYYGITFAQAYYNLHHHPLAKFRGPKEASQSEKWLTNLKTKPARMPEEIFEELHDEYKCEALRIGPNELHLQNVHLYKTIYNQTTPYTKEVPFYDAFLTPHTVFAETDVGLHRQRRKLLNPFFARGGVLKLQSLMHDKMDAMIEKCHKIASKGPIDAAMMFRCVTVDVISQFAFGKTMDLLHEQDDGFKASFLRGVDKTGESLPFLQRQLITRKMAMMMPLSLAAKLDSAVGEIYKTQQFAHQCLTEYHKRTSRPEHPVIFDSLLGLPEDQLAAESIDILIAGADTTASTLATGLYYILRDERVKAKLIQAVRHAVPDPNEIPDLRELENVEYLWATVKESLRLAVPVPGILPRVVPKDTAPLVADGMVIPPGTIVGISAYTMNRSKEIWGPDAHEYKPERWLGESGKAMDQWLCTFSKGVRQCIGINIAHAEITIGLAYVFSHFDLELVTKSLYGRDNFVSTLESGCWVRFTPLKQK